MYIKKLELLNFQVIEKFNAEFSGNVYFITGDNELGKSTLLKAIAALLTGERDGVLRNGASKGFAKMVVGDDGEEFDVSLSFTENNPRGTLTIKQKSTGMSTSNVSMLQRIFGYQNFDAVEFSRWSETAEGRRKQIAVVKNLLPPDIRDRVTEIDAEVEALKAERTGVNRDVKTYGMIVSNLEKQLKPGDKEKYAAPIDVTDLMQRQQTNAALIEKSKTVRASLKQRIEQLNGIQGRIDEAKEKRDAGIQEWDNKIAELESQLKKMKDDAVEAKEKIKSDYRAEVAKIDEDRADYERRKANCEKWIAEYEAKNPENDNVPELLKEAENHNKIHAVVKDLTAKESELNAVKAKADSMDTKIVELGYERKELINKSKLPIEGLTFTEDGLELNAVPFIPGKVSDSQIMEVATKLVIAGNPTVKVFCIARGESLGQKRLESILDIAKKNGFQGFVEQVKRGQDEMLIEEYTEAE